MSVKQKKYNIFLCVFRTHPGMFNVNNTRSPVGRQLKNSFIILDKIFYYALNKA
jgi:hypothetical protein